MCNLFFTVFSLLYATSYLSAMTHESTNACIFTLQKRCSAISKVISLDDDHIAYFVYNKIRVYNRKTSQKIGTFRGHLLNINALISLNDNLIASCSDNSIRVVNWKTGVSVRYDTDHTNNITSLLFLNDNAIASSSLDGTIKIWNTNNFQCLASLIGHNEPIMSLTNVGDQKIASQAKSGTIKIWDLALIKKSEQSDCKTM